MITMDDYALDVAAGNLLRESGEAMTWERARHLAGAAVAQYLHTLDRPKRKEAVLHELREGIRVIAHSLPLRHEAQTQLLALIGAPTATLETHNPELDRACPLCQPGQGCNRRVDGATFAAIAQHYPIPEM